MKTELSTALLTVVQAAVAALVPVLVVMVAPVATDRKLYTQTLTTPQMRQQKMVETANQLVPFCYLAL